jgi:hypothetical protein
VKESFTAAIVVRSLWAALGEVWVAGFVVFVDRIVVCGLVVGSVVVAVDIWVRGISLGVGSVEGPAAQTGGGSGWEKSLAGGDFRALGSPTSHQGDWGAVYQQTRLWVWKSLDETGGREGIGL